MIHKTKLTRGSRLLLFILIALLAGCASKHSGRYASAYNRPRLSAAAYLQIAATSQGPAKQQALLNAAQTLTQDHKLKHAQLVINQIDTGLLTPEETNKKQLIQANILLGDQRTQSAMDMLNKLAKQKNQLSTNNQIMLHELLAQGYKAKGAIVNTISERNQLIPLIKNEAEQRRNLSAIWKDVEGINTQSLEDLAAQTPSKTLRGWFSLALITQTDKSAQQLQQSLLSWRASFPHHPANFLLPKNIRQHQLAGNLQPQHIALLLPMQGQFAKSAKAIRNGFLAAYYYDRSHNKKAPSIKVYDTSKENVITLYNKAVSEGADFIVGPLIKNNVAELIGYDHLPVPTLALNTLANRIDQIKNLYQFGLSPLDEAYQAALKAWDDHHRNIVIIVPNNQRGNNIAQSFSQEWQQLGGNVVAQLSYGSQESLAQNISKLLDIHQSHQRERKLKRIIHKKMRFIPRRRKDFDAIFLVAKPALARQIRPMLRFYFAGEVPVYATSEVYSGSPNPRKDHDLNGIYFSDMPWVTRQNQMSTTTLDAIRQQVRSMWPGSYANYSKLYALGVDAYNVVPRLEKMIMLPQVGIKAATGTLYLDANHHLYRKLEWSKMVRGEPTPVRPNT